MIKILIIEDEPAMLAGLCDNLEFEGYTVKTSDRGDTGLKLWESEEFNLEQLTMLLLELLVTKTLHQFQQML